MDQNWAASQQPSAPGLDPRTILKAIDMLKAEGTSRGTFVKPAE
ncbi:hypothetical protein ABT299_51375 [Spirillospora sp. NPDC000708]